MGGLPDGRAADQVRFLPVSLSPGSAEPGQLGEFMSIMSRMKLRTSTMMPTRWRLIIIIIIIKPNNAPIPVQSTQP
jgi:hypothetical protein